MTISETKKAIEDALYNGNPLSFEAMLNCYGVIQNFLTTHADYDINVEAEVNKIACFFEKEENWKAMKNCWLEDGYSKDLRELLKLALK